MHKIVIITTGGTFSKVYNPINGKLEVDTEALALKEIAKKWRCEFEIVTLMAKDSLDMTNADRMELLSTIHRSSYSHVLVIHGTDTMNLTAEYLADAELEKTIVLTGAMVPYSIDPTEATANLASAYAYLHTLEEQGIFIAMSGLFGSFEKVKKNRKEGRFTLSR